MNYLEKNIKFLKLFYKSSFYGFVSGHYYLKKNQIPTLENLKENDDDDIIEFEKNFANMVGLGYTVSFAAGRMGFFSLMKILEIEKRDEVILQGHTCSVMVNAVFRVGATPIFADIDRNTFGSSKIEIEKKYLQVRK